MPMLNTIWALMYANGQGVPEDDATAVKWYTKAAEQGMPMLNINLGLCMTTVKAYQRMMQLL